MKITTSFLFSISILLLLCIGLACRPQTNPILLRAEVMMAKQPDKAYHLLKDSILPQPNLSQPVDVHPFINQPIILKL